MPKEISHGSQIRFVQLRDGLFSMRRLDPNAKEIRRRRSLAVLMGTDLLEWVANPQTIAQRRIDTILKLIIQLRDLNRANGKSDEIPVLWQGKRFKTSRHIYSKRTNKAEEELSGKLNKCLERYKFSPTYWHQLDDIPIIGWFSAPEPTEPSDERVGFSFSEGDALLCIMELAREDLFKDLRVCHCGKWFFARFIHHKFCSQSCQQTHHRSNPEYREAHRVYVKNLRAMHKERYFPSPKRKAAVKRSIRSSSSEVNGAVQPKKAR